MRSGSSPESAAGDVHDRGRGMKNPRGVFHPPLDPRGISARSTASESARHGCGPPRASQHRVIWAQAKLVGTVQQARCETVRPRAAAGCARNQRPAPARNARCRRIPPARRGSWICTCRPASRQSPLPSSTRVKPVHIDTGVMVPQHAINAVSRRHRASMSGIQSMQRSQSTRSQVSATRSGCSSLPRRTIS